MGSINVRLIPIGSSGYHIDTIRVSEGMKEGLVVTSYQMEVSRYLWVVGGIISIPQR